MIEIIKKLYEIASGFGRKKLLFFAGSTIALVIVSVCATLSVTPLMQMVFNAEKSKVIGGLELSFIGVLCIFSILQLLHCVMNVVNELVKNKYVTSFGAWLRVTMLNKVMQRDYAYFVAQDGAKVQQVVNVYSANLGLITQSTMELISKVVIVIGYVLVGLVINWQLSLVIAVFAAVFYLGLIKGLKPLRHRVNTELKSAQAELQSYSMQTISGVKFLRVSNSADIFVEQYTFQAKRAARAMVLPMLLSHIPKYILELFLLLGIAAYMYYQFLSENLVAALPSISVMVFIAFKVFPLIQNVYSNYIGIATQAYLVQEIYQEYHQENKRKDIKPITLNKSIQTKNLTFKYSEDSPTIQFPDIEILKGKVIGIKGASGSGKSTLLDLLLGLFEPTSGTISIDAKVVSDAELRGLYSEIGYVGQDTYLLNMSLAENVALNTKENVNKAKLTKALKLANLTDFIEQLPQGVDTNVGDRGVRLSGGQRQRLAIARALYREPTILLLDEATSALDDDTEKRVMDTIYNLPKEMTIILIAHRLSTLERADQVVSIDKLDIG